jgi:hypothetical protein
MILGITIGQQLPQDRSGTVNCWWLWGGPRPTRDLDERRDATLPTHALKIEGIDFAAIHEHVARTKVFRGKPHRGVCTD